MGASNGCKRCAAGIPHDFSHDAYNGYRYHGCRCQTCSDAHRAICRERYWKTRDRQLELKREHRSKNIERYRTREQVKRSTPEALATRMRRDTRMKAIPVTRQRYWTEIECQIVLRSDITVIEMAYILQRSYRSVVAKRQHLLYPERIYARNQSWRERNPRTLKGRIKSHCKRGHEFTDENVYIDPKRGHRHCRKCREKPKSQRERATHCPNGHEWNAKNTYLYGNGYRNCRTCNRLRNQTTHHQKEIA